MKRRKMILSLLAIVAVVGSALAFKSSTYFGAGNIYCGPANLSPEEQECVCKTEPIDFTYVGSNPGTTTDPCPGPDIPYWLRFDPITGTFKCMPIFPGNFVPVPLGK